VGAILGEKQALLQGADQAGQVAVLALEPVGQADQLERGRGV
jgi:hypothetical protein